MSDEALPCPFCGGTEIRFQPGAIRDTEKLWCGHCGACGDYYSDRNLAVQNWNRRIPSVSTAELEKLAKEWEVSADESSAKQGPSYVTPISRAIAMQLFCAAGLRSLISKATNGRGK